jgi:integrase
LESAENAYQNSVQSVWVWLGCLISVRVSVPLLEFNLLREIGSDTFARVSAVVALNVEDYFPLKKRWWLRLREKNGKINEMPCHHKLEAFLDAYIDAAGIERDRKGPLFRAAIGKTKKLGPGRMSRTDVWYMVRRRASDAGIETPIGCHTFRATGIMDYLTNGGRIEVAQKMAGHSNAKTTGLYDRRNDDISVGEVERIGI